MLLPLALEVQPLHLDNRRPRLLDLVSLLLLVLSVNHSNHLLEEVCLDLLQLKVVCLVNQLQLPALQLDLDLVLLRNNLLVQPGVCLDKLLLNNLPQVAYLDNLLPQLLARVDFSGQSLVSFLFVLTLFSPGLQT